MLEESEKDLLFWEILQMQAQLRARAANHLPSNLKAKCDPSDILQQTLIDIQQSSTPPKFASKRERQFWILKVFDNNLFDVVRHYTEVSKRLVTRELSLERCRALFTCDSNPSKNLRNEDKKRMVRMVLQQLKPQHRLVLEWYFLEGMSMVSIGRQLDRSEDSVRMAINRALVRALSILQRQGIQTASV
jgi:RNA polymerase sigma factor (sigma-70 family)